MSDRIDSMFSLRNLKKVLGSRKKPRVDDSRGPSGHSSADVSHGGYDPVYVSREGPNLANISRIDQNIIDISRSDHNPVGAIDQFGHRVGQFRQTLENFKDLGDLPKVLTSASDVVSLALNLKVTNEHAEDWDQFLQILKRHKASWMNDRTKLEEDNTFKRDSELNNTPAKDEFNEFTYLINRSKAALESYTQQLQEVERILRTSITRGNIGVVTARMEGAVGDYTLALQAIVGIEVEIIQQNLSKVYVDRYDEARIMQRGAKNTTVEGDQHSDLFLTGTRGKILRDIQKWLEEGLEQMYCLLDVAGAGKSTLAKHIEEEWRDNGSLLVARFFFSRNKPETRTTDLFCSTVSGHFAARSELFAEHLRNSKENNRDAGKTFKDQFKVQIIKPFERYYARPRPLEIENAPPAILIIDALDECDDNDGDRERLLKTLQDALKSLPELRIFATGRPHRDIKNALHGPNIRITHFRETENDNNDVTFYVTQRLSQDKVNPFSANIKREIAGLAAGHFIWARVACDLLVRAIDRDRLLREFKEKVSEDDRLNHLYIIAIRESAPQGENQVISLVLQALFAAEKPLSIEELEQLFPKPGLVQPVITALSCLLIFDGRSGPIRPLHLTFREFITDKTTSGDYFVPLELGHHILALKCVEVLCNMHRYNPLGSQNPTVISKSVWDYSSLYWEHHSIMCYGKLYINHYILDFTEKGLVSWMDDLGHKEFVGYTKKVLNSALGNLSPQVKDALIRLSMKKVLLDILNGWFCWLTIE